MWFEFGFQTLQEEAQNCYVATMCSEIGKFIIKTGFATVVKLPMI
jgi:hypothetical protein